MHFRPDESGYSVQLVHGCIVFGSSPKPFTWPPGTPLYPASRSQAFSSSFRIWEVLWLPRLGVPDAIVSLAAGYQQLTCPLWIPFVFTALPTAYLFWRDRRHPPGHCQRCGYNLKGNESGVCPECGESCC